MAIDVYLQIDGIKGESSDETHKDWIECSSVHWGIVQPRSATSSTAGGHTAERAELSDIAFHKLSDLSSPILMQTCASGRTIPKAKFEFMRADGQGERIKYFEIELENVLISHITPSIDPGILLNENVGLKFSKVRWKYSKQKIGGGVSGNTAGGWDLAPIRLGYSLQLSSSVARRAYATSRIAQVRLRSLAEWCYQSRGRPQLGCLRLRHQDGCRRVQRPPDAYPSLPGGGLETD